MKNIFLFALLLLLSAGSSASQDVRWYDGKIAPIPSGSLITNNPGYWDKIIPTDVTYSYPVSPDNPPDNLGPKKSTFGNRLLDGQSNGDWFTPVGMNYKPLVVDFDFHQQIELSEMAVAQYRSHDLKLAQIEVRNNPESPWTKVLLENDIKGSLHHLKLAKSVLARYVRLTVQSAENITYISEVWMWGDAKPVVTKTADGYLPEMKQFLEEQKANPGDGTILSPETLAAWRAKSGFTQNGLTWQVAPTWRMLAKDPLKSTFLPGKETLQKPVQMSATRTEGESAAVFLVNASDAAKDVTVTLSAFKNDVNARSLSGAEGKSHGMDTSASLSDRFAKPTDKSTFAGNAQLFVAGAIWTKRWGQTLRPLFSADNKLGSGQMQKYLTNGSVIKDFPTLHLPPRGTALLWVTVNTQNADPGNYTAILNAGENKIPVHLKVLSVTLPQPDSWVRFWGNTPAGNHNLWSSEDDLKTEIAYQQSMGVTVWSGWPTKGSYQETAREMAQERGMRSYFITNISADIQNDGYLGKLDPTKFDDAFKQKVKTEIDEKVQTAQSLGLDYKDWCIELWDEPNPSNMPAWAGVARIIRAANPNVQIYMNPLFWTRQGDNRYGFATDASQVKALQGWYNALVDIAMPILGQVNSKEYPQANADFYNHLPRAVRGYYIHPNPGRMLTWEAAVRDFNGWGFYAYYVPSKDAWNDFDSPAYAGFDYEIVYPGPKGFIPTIESESMRESWEDYRLLTLLKQQGKTEEAGNILRMYQNGVIDLPNDETPADRDARSIKAAEMLPLLRERMMRDVANDKNEVP